jgi:plastocyanin
MIAAAIERRQRTRAVALACCVGMCAMLAVPVEASAKTWTVKIDGMQFKPDTLTVGRGDTIVWINDDPVAHTATSVAAGAFDSRTIAPGGRWTYRAAAPGRYPYACTFHPTMRATVVVKDMP